MTPDEFIRKWKAAELKERSAAQEHFIDICRMLGESTPAEADPTGEWYCFERGASKVTGVDGWADVWKRGHFGWEYKGKRKDLNAAFVQLQQYAIALENPPLLIVCDLDRFRIHTNWTNTVSTVHEFSLDDLRNANVRDKLKSAFADPERLKPSTTRQDITEKAAGEFAELAQRLRAKGHGPETVAHFVNRLVFCMFAEDIGLLPNMMFVRMLNFTRQQPQVFQSAASQLFGAMRSGGMVGFEPVEWFNGGLFDDDAALPLDRTEIELAIRAAKMDWSEIDPSIFGTLFERGLDPDKRSQLGAHYTDREKIMQIIEPVIVRPWLREWQAVKADIAELLERAQQARERRPAHAREARRVYAAARRAEETASRRAREKFLTFMEKLRNFRVLDPACGSGNFLYLALRSLKDLELRFGIEAENMSLDRPVILIGPEVVRGIEVNRYAAELARVTVWIGEIQWMRKNGFDASRMPILKPLDNIECRDALVNEDGTESQWPRSDVIVGNPPFLGNKKMRGLLGDDYLTRIRMSFKGTLPGACDLVCYWFEKSRQLAVRGMVQRVGLVATKTIQSSRP